MGNAQDARVDNIVHINTLATRIDHLQRAPIKAKERRARIRAKAKVRENPRGARAQSLLIKRKVPRQVAKGTGPFANFSPKANATRGMHVTSTISMYALILKRALASREIVADIFT